MKFTVQHFMFCESVDYRDRSRPHWNSILDGVDFVFGVPSGTEFPFEPEEFWSFVRFYSTSETSGNTQPLSVICYWIDSPSGEEEVEVWARDIGADHVSSAVRGDRPELGVPKSRRRREDVSLPGPGRYVFKLGHATKKYPNWRVKAREFISVEGQP